MTGSVQSDDRSENITVTLLLISVSVPYKVLSEERTGQTTGPADVQLPDFSFFPNLVNVYV